MLRFSFKWVLPVLCSAGAFMLMDRPFWTAMGVVGLFTLGEALNKVGREYL